MLNIITGCCYTLNRLNVNWKIKKRRENYERENLFSAFIVDLYNDGVSSMLRAAVVISRDFDAAGLRQYGGRIHRRDAKR